MTPKIAPAKGKLGILTPGMGAVSTTFMAGVEAVKKGLGAASALGAVLEPSARTFESLSARVSRAVSSLVTTELLGVYGVRVAKWFLKSFSLLSRSAQQSMRRLR